MARGFNYFDTAHVYHSGNSETALRTCLTSRYPRESYVLVDKLSGSCFQTEEDIRPLFATQLEACGVDYFDIYLMHSQGAKVFAKFKQCRAYETAFALKEEGKIRHVGLSFHDTGGGAGPDPHRVPPDRGGADPVQLSGLRKPVGGGPPVL